MPFAETYQLFHMELACVVVRASSTFELEHKLYQFINRKVLPLGMSFNRIETKNQAGMPDMLLLKNEHYWLIEGKMLKKASLKDIQNDITYEFGQFAFAIKSWKAGLSYILAVARDNKVAFIYNKENKSCRKLIQKIKF